MPASKILDAQSAVAARAQREVGLAFSPVRDAQTVPQSPLDAVRAGSAARVPLIVGTNRDEVKLFASTQRREEIDPESLRAQVVAALGKRSPEEAASLIDVYQASRTAKRLPTTNLDILDAISSDARFRIPATRLALAHAAHQPDTYVYLFTHESPALHGALGACHALEMPFVFGTLGAPTQDRFAGSGPEVERLSAAMMDSWLSFARTGRPRSEDLAPWPWYDPSRPTMVFDKPPHMEQDPFREERLAIEKLI
jgi:para-nitrobenzyl esterase